MAEARGSSNIYIYGNITNLSSLTIWLKVRELFFFYGIGSGFPCRGLVFLKARCFSFFFFWSKPVVFLKQGLQTAQVTCNGQKVHAQKDQYSLHYHETTKEIQLAAWCHFLQFSKLVSHNK